jgi:hypothetical protein
MDNPEKLAILGTQDTRQRQQKQNKKNAQETKKISNTGKELEKLNLFLLLISHPLLSNVCFQNIF